MHPVLSSTDAKQRAWLVPDRANPFAPSPTWITDFLAQSRWDRAAFLTCLGVQHSGWTGNGALVVAGQQPALGGGPFYTLVKTAQAVALAQALNTDDHPVLPAFWCASDDHDLGEAAHVDLILRNGSIYRHACDFGSQRALRHIPAQQGWDDLLAACRQHLGPGLGEAWLRDHAPQAGDMLGAWQNRMLSALFPGSGLLTCEAWRLRPLWRHRLAEAVQQWPGEALHARQAELKALGLNAPFPDIHAAPIFHDSMTARRAVSGETLARLLAEDPESLSPGAALRPILQQVAMPAAVVVLGPGELGYHAVLQAAYANMDLPRPLPAPRSSVMLAPRWWRNGMQAWATREPSLDLSTLDVALATLARVEVDTPLRPTLLAGISRLRSERDRLHGHLERAQRRHAGRPARGVLEAWAHPRGAGQDRTLSVIQAIWDCGPGIATALVSLLAAHPPGSDLQLPI